MVDFDVLKRDIGGYDLHIAFDYFPAYKGHPEQDVMFISTQNDPSVGIFGVVVSPYFKNVKELDNWWKKNKKKVIKKYG